MDRKCHGPHECPRPVSENEGRLAPSGRGHRHPLHRRHFGRIYGGGGGKHTLGLCIWTPEVNHTPPRKSIPFLCNHKPVDQPFSWSIRRFFNKPVSDPFVYDNFLVGLAPFPMHGEGFGTVWDGVVFQGYVGRPIQTAMGGSRYNSGRKTVSL